MSGHLLIHRASKDGAVEDCAVCRANAVPTVDAMVAVLHEHYPVARDEDAKPYKAQCKCGEWWYDFDHHRARVILGLTTRADR